MDNLSFPNLESSFIRSLFNTFRSYIPSTFFPHSHVLNIDNRGMFVEYARADTSGQSSYSLTFPEITRGNHYHIRKAERFSVIKGKALIQLRKIGTNDIINYELDGDKPSFVDMPVWYTHNIKNVGTEELITELKDFGVTIHSTGGETADVGDLVRTIIVDSTVTARMKRSDVIDNANIAPGDVIVGLESFGQATYEKEYNGGMGSNGLTSARHDVFHKYLAEKYPESFDAAVPEDLVYSGQTKLTDKVENSPIDAGKLVLSPTRTYAPIIKAILSKYKSDTVHGMIHCSGGAQTKILHFVDNLHIVKDNMFPIPPLFKLIQDQSKTDWKEMYQVFNCGHRMELYVKPEVAEDIIAISKSFNVDAKIVGRVEASDSKKLTINSEYGIFEY